MKNGVRIKWFKEPQVHDYPNARSFLSLIYPGEKAEKLVKKLERAPMSEFRARDIFRASGLPLMGLSNSHLKADQEKIRRGQKLSPLLLVRDKTNGKVVIADGYHRMCAVYSFNEDVLIPCKIV